MPIVLSSYWGSGSDVLHYAYLSERCSEIAREHHQSGAQRRTCGEARTGASAPATGPARIQISQRATAGQWLEEQIVALATTQTDRGLVMTLGDVLFDTGEAELKNSANRVVLKIVQFLQLNPKRVVRIEGYADSTGGKQENLKLSRDRAQSWRTC